MTGQKVTDEIALGAAISMGPISEYPLKWTRLPGRQQIEKDRIDT